jgi:CspA family cold shock protein
MEGTVKFFNEAKGFGFVIDDADGTEYFTHATGLKDGTTLNEGDKVEFTIEEGRKGLNATKVTVIG